MKLLLRLSIVLLFAAACAAPSKTKKTDEAAKVETAKPANVRLTECKSNSDVRSLEIKDADGGSFDLIYTKFGNGKSIANGTRPHCEKIRDRVKKNLESAGFSCS